MTVSRISELLPPLLTTQRSSWEQGITAQALLEAHRDRAISTNCYDTIPNLLPYIHGLVYDAVVRQGSDGRLAVVLNGDGTSDPGALDPACIGEALYYLLHHHSTEISHGKFSIAANRMLDYVLIACPRAPIVENTFSSQDDNLILSHRIDSVQIWSDTIYMLPPFLVSAAVYYSHHPESNSRYHPANLIRMSLKQIILAAQVLQAPTGEWSHIYDLSKRKFERKTFWGVGNGWVCAGIIRVFTIFATAIQSRPEFGHYLDDEDTQKCLSRSYDILRRTFHACLRHIRPDNLFHNVLDDPSSFVETNLTQQLCYTLYTMLSLHIHTPFEITTLLNLPHLSLESIEEWKLRADAMRDAAVTKIDQWGFVRDVCGSPSFDKPGTAAEGQAWAIMMEVSRIKFLRQQEKLHDSEGD
ncbi:hypothetical protein QCA50_002706 [Cerrena zonata]|uniref:Uncharacterized protein n=1 Tax=Cerrena zonata TaxID=2478898 RepID=A0AAW0GQ25_9APHY